MNNEEKIDIHLKIRQKRIDDVRICTQRNFGLVKLFENKPVADTMRILPTFFSLCEKAQTAAATTACAMAQGKEIPSTPDVVAEIIAEHGLSLVRDWLPADKIILAKPFRAVLKVGASAWPAAIEALDVLLQAPADAVLRDGTGFRTWRSQSKSPLAQIMRHWHNDGMDGFGQTQFHPLQDVPSLSVLRKLLYGDADASLALCAEPRENYEVGPLSRQHHQPLIQELMAECGNGLLPRFVARLVELHRLLQNPHISLTTTLPFLPDTLEDGAGIGVVEAARGVLMHLVTADNTLVHRYRIIAPTAWNFHPRGVLYQGLIHQPASPHIAAYVRMLVNALDPCVRAHIHIEGDFAHA